MDDWRKTLYSVIAQPLNISIFSKTYDLIVICESIVSLFCVWYLKLCKLRRSTWKKIICFIFKICYKYLIVFKYCSKLGNFKASMLLSASYFFLALPVYCGLLFIVELHVLYAYLQNFAQVFYFLTLLIVADFCIWLFLLFGQLFLYSTPYDDIVCKPLYIFSQIFILSTVFGLSYAFCVEYECQHCAQLVWFHNFGLYCVCK